VISKPIICYRCDSFTGKHIFTKDEKPSGEHEFLEDCILQLSRRIGDMEEEVKSLKGEQRWKRKVLV
jgi:hypothetical protein